MDKTNPSLLKKTCQSCGLEKPLTAFLIHSAKQSAVYGTICSTCRGSDGPITEDSDDADETINKPALRIGNKEKVAGDIDRKERFKQTEEEYYKEREQDEMQALKNTLKGEKIQTKEKEHHKSYLEKRSFLSSPQKIGANTDKTLFGGIEQAAKEGEINTAAPIIDVAIPKLKHQSALFQQFKTLLGSSSPLVAAAERALAKEKGVSATDSPSEYLEKNWVPPTKRTGK